MYGGRGLGVLWVGRTVILTRRPFIPAPPVTINGAPTAAVIVVDPVALRAEFAPDINISPEVEAEHHRRILGVE